MVTSFFLVRCLQQKNKLIENFKNFDSHTIESIEFLFSYVIYKNEFSFAIVADYLLCQSSLSLDIVDLPITRYYSRRRWIFSEFGQKSANILIVTRLAPRLVVRTAHDRKYLFACASTVFMEILHHAGWYQRIRQTRNEQGGCRD